MVILKLVILLVAVILVEIANERFWFKRCSEKFSIWFQCLGSFFTSLLFLVLLSQAIHFLFE